MKRNYSVSIVFPAYNEEEIIEKTVETTFKAVKKMNLKKFEIIVVDDGSKDNTPKILSKLAKKHKGVLKILTHKKNLCYAKALKTGFKAAKYPLVFYTDADLQFDVSELPLLLGRAKDFDIVAGYRAKRHDAPHRLLISWAYNRFVNVLFSLNLKDVDCAFKLFSKKALDEIEIESTGFIVDLEILAKARKKGFLIGEVPVSHFERPLGTSKVTSKLVFETISDIAWLKKKIRKEDKKRSAENRKK